MTRRARIPCGTTRRRTTVRRVSSRAAGAPSSLRQVHEGGVFQVILPRGDVVLDELVIGQQLLGLGVEILFGHGLALGVQIDVLAFRNAVPTLDVVDHRRFHGRDLGVHFGEERQIRRHLGIHMLGGLRHKEVGRRIVGVADLVALRAGSLVGPDEVVRLMQRQRVASSAEADE